MVVCNRLGDIPKISQSSLTIGSFDGIHAGHIEILKKLNVLSSTNQSQSVVITFNPHPKYVLKKNSNEQRNVLMDINKKLDVFKFYHIVFIYFVRFYL